MGSARAKVKDLDRVVCRQDGESDDGGDGRKGGISVTEIGPRLGTVCEPYILPLFHSVSREEMMGQNVTWLCKVRLTASTVNVTGETLVLNKNFASIKQGFCQH